MSGSGVPMAFPRTQARRSWWFVLPTVGVTVALVGIVLAGPLLEPAPAAAATEVGSSAAGSPAIPYVAYTLNLLNGSLLPQNVPAPGCSLPRPAPYIVHFPEGPTAALDLPGLNELFVACPTGNLLVINDTTGALISTISVGLG
ncbi:MAG: hypothetical protein WB579_04485, partial [Bryobacteraceae bacterium]